VRYGGAFSGFLARPERAETPLPGVIVIQEVWGVDRHIEDVTRRFASAGYLALAPDLYARNGERTAALRAERIAELQDFMNALPPAAFSDPSLREAALEKRPESERDRIHESFGAMMSGLSNLAGHLPQVLETARYLREECPATRGAKVGSVGYCMGGALSALLACHDPRLSAAAIYYGSAPKPDLLAAIACPVVGFYGGMDARINDGIPSFEDAMKRQGKRFEYTIYDGAPHAFFNDTRPSYRVGAARDAFLKTLQFFRNELA
jgi:carboxymethylenebutenolidase